jgi:hypothetical protein
VDWDLTDLYATPKAWDDSTPDPRGEEAFGVQGTRQERRCHGHKVVAISDLNRG